MRRRRLRLAHALPDVAPSPPAAPGSTRVATVVGCGMLWASLRLCDGYLLLFALQSAMVLLTLDRSRRTLLRLTFGATMVGRRFPMAAVAVLQNVVCLWHILVYRTRWGRRCIGIRALRWVCIAHWLLCARLCVTLGYAAVASASPTALLRVALVLLL